MTATTQNTSLRFALAYHRLGWQPIPLRPLEKRPLISWEAYQTQRITVEQITAWWTEHPDAGIGIVTGSISGILALDVDGAEGEETLRQFPQGDPTPCSQTGRGFHHIYRYPPDGGPYGNFVRKLPGLDFRGDGGYIVAPPTMHPETKKPYVWELSPSKQAPAELPDWLLAVLTTVPARTAEPQAIAGNGKFSRRTLEFLALGVPKGERNDRLFKAACDFAGNGYSQVDAEAILLPAAVQYGLPQDEARGAIESAYKKPRQPAIPPPAKGESTTAGAEGSPSCEEPTPRKEPKEPQAAVLVRLATESATLFRDDTHDAHVQITVEGHTEVWRCQSKAFRQWLARQLWETRRKTPNRESLSSAIMTLEGMARWEGQEYPLRNRVAWRGGAIFYDLSNPEWQTVKTDPAGWEVTEPPCPMFRRYSHQRAQATPRQGTDPWEVFRFVNIEDPERQLLFVVYLVSCLIPDIPHPVLILHGAQGSAKSTACSVLKRLIDPSAVDVLTFSKDKTELIQQLSHHWCAAFDNLSHLGEEHSNLPCRACTGEGFSKRELFSDDDDVIYSFKRCVALNGVNIAATRPDLLDRAILLKLDRIAENRRQEEAVFWKSFEDALPGIVGGLFDTLSRAMTLYPDTRLSELYRMADFTRWGCAIAEALGKTRSEFLHAYGANIRSHHEEVVQASAVATSLLAWMEEKTEWRGTPSELYESLCGVAEEQKIHTKAKGWPKAPQALTARLNELSTTLAELGITIERGDRRSFVITRKDGANSVRTVQSVQHTEQQDDAEHAPLHAPMSNSVQTVQGPCSLNLFGDNALHAPHAPHAPFGNLAGDVSEDLEASEDLCHVDL